ncbi:hypothetical protein GO287_02053 [Ralstonia solanacearum]|uniref:hypothetical protein n=1 Tax=Ralstonia pseudosolanacearum TaxID=1310165 RepID=UPI001402B311|nr:hypothetical protein [Ralstonia pseudosolanacearum]KAF3461273.1 hypothetical protein GO278_000777 [Ralstonia solanacearum]NKA77502.1 hypothetical protein [Ralstonia solanacearum]NKG00125.1 hypothetical protein [Ralstonia solanacearum]NKG04848.1 hypothetical protein [Ralstonia solanacearum]UNJ30247.1 hypothetical protein MNY32_02710 [Ralstonia pseudosolanacearum]
MAKVYEQKRIYYCLGAIYDHGRVFADAGRHLIESGGALAVPGMVNICLATEIFLKSINAVESHLEDEQEVNGTKVLVGRDDSVKLVTGDKEHKLSKLFDKLPGDAKAEIVESAKGEGFDGSVSHGLTLYDKVFVDWRYIYEKKDPQALGTHPLFQIVNAIDAYCQKYRNRVREATADLVDAAS